MWYAIVVEKHGYGRMLGVYPVPTEERAKTLAYCMNGFWRYKGVRISNTLPAKEEGMYTMYNQGYKAGTVEGKMSEAEQFYCRPNAVNWKPGMKRCL